jgi:hypothetical protein
MTVIMTFSELAEGELSHLYFLLNSAYYIHILYEGQADRDTERESIMETHKNTVDIGEESKYYNRQAGRQAGRQTDIQTGRQADRQTDRQTDGETEKQRNNV